MEEFPLTARETLLLLTVFVGPFVLIGAAAQLILLRRAGQSALRCAGVLVTASMLAVVGTLLLVRVINFSWSDMLGDVLALPALLAAGIVTAAVAVLSRRRRPAV